MIIYIEAPVTIVATAKTIALNQDNLISRVVFSAFDRRKQNHPIDKLVITDK